MWNAFSCGSWLACDGTTTIPTTVVGIGQILCYIPRPRFFIFTPVTVMQTAKPLFDYPKYWAECFGPAPFLPMSREEMDQLGWDSCDIIIVTGDAYVDHPSFGMAIIGRAAGVPGLSRRDHRATELAVQRRLHEARRAEPVLRRRGRQHGLDDQPLHRRQENPLR